MVVAHQALWVASLAALGLAGARVAGRCTQAALPRALAAAVIGAALAAVEALGLGLLALGGSPLALAAAAWLTALGVLRALPPRAPTLREQLRGAWGALGIRERLAAGAIAGLAAGLAASLALVPALGID